MLPESPPEKLVNTVWPSMVPPGTVTYGRMYRFPILPLELFSTLLVRYLHILGVKPLAFWRTGMVIRRKSECARIDHDLDARTCTIVVRHVPEDEDSMFNLNRSVYSFQKSLESGRGSSLLLRELVSSFETVADGQYKMSRSMSRFVMCSHCLGIFEGEWGDVKDDVFMFPFEDVMASHANPGPLFCCGIRSTTRCVFVSQIAPDVAPLP